jgi:crotonobetainyl-CoA:carnitine CoA-transferase CaiB-like acyl-CoA transferase
VAHYAETEALVSGWTASHTRGEIFAATSRYRIPCAPVRDIEEVMLDPHMHGRGMLEVVDHYDYGPVVLPNSPLRFHGPDGIETVETQVSPRVGEHNQAIYGGWLGLADTEIARLKAADAI